MSFILNWAQDKAAGLLATGLQAGGTMAGNAVGGVGALIENSGRAMGEGAFATTEGCLLLLPYIPPCSRVVLDS